MTFYDLGLSSPLVRAVAAQHYTVPFPVQEAAIPAILGRKDVFGIAQTGSGKTAGFVLPIIEILQDEPQMPHRHIHTLVLVPTRELAVQVCEVFKNMERFMPVEVRAMAVYGGVSINPQMQNLRGVQVLVATPGRLLELHRSNAFSLSLLQILVLDEADKMLNLGFKEEMDQIFALLPKKRQNILFSATTDEEVLDIQRKLLHQPIMIEIEQEKWSDEWVDQRAYRVEGEEKGPFLRQLIERENMERVLIFTSSIRRADNVALKLNKNGIPADTLHSQKSQGGRLGALEKFKKGKIRALVATDLAARGIDIPNLPFVVNYELPRSPKDYVHRIGRTGRAQAKGVAISLIEAQDEPHFKIIQKKMGKQVPLLDASNE